MRLERFPLLKRCLAERQPVFLRRREPIDLNGEAVQTHPWYFAALPLLQGQQVEGFLCVENIKEHGEDVGLFGTLVPLLLQQRERFHTEERSAATMEQLMSLPDLRAYSQAVYSITSEYYSSMGVVGLDIPGFADINSRFGFEYGSKMLWYVAKTLTDLFGTAMLFRTWESEFAVFYPNTTREVLWSAAAGCALSFSGVTRNRSASAAPGLPVCLQESAWPKRRGRRCAERLPVMTGAWNLFPSA